MEGSYDCGLGTRGRGQSRGEHREQNNGARGNAGADGCESGLRRAGRGEESDGMFWNREGSIIARMMLDGVEAPQKANRRRANWGPV